MSVGTGRLGLAILVACCLSTGASAWQRPQPAPAAKAQACPEMGEGFVRIPGSATCIRLGGSVRIEASHIGAASSLYPTDR